MSTERIIEKLKKLKMHADSAASLGSEAEALAFAEKFQQMLIEHKIDMTDIEFDAFEKAEPVEKHWIDYEKYPDVQLRQKRVEWIERLAAVIAHAHFCQILVTHNSSRITLVGRKSDTAVAEYMLITLQRAAEKLADAEYARFSIECVKQCKHCLQTKDKHERVTLRCPTQPTYYGSGSWRKFKPNWRRCRGFRPAFLDAFINRLLHRYAEIRARQGQGCTALVRSEKAVADWVNQNIKKTAGGLSRTTAWNREGVRRGTDAADKIDLNGKAVEASTERRKALK